MSDDAFLGEFANFTSSESEASDTDCCDKPLSRSAKLAFSEPLFLDQIRQWGAPECELSLYTTRHTFTLPSRWAPHPVLAQPLDSNPPELVETYFVKERAELGQAKEWIEKLGGASRAKAYAEEKYYLRKWEDARVVAEMVLRVWDREGFARGSGMGEADIRDLKVLVERAGKKVGN